MSDDDKAREELEKAKAEDELAAKKEDDLKKAAEDETKTKAEEKVDREELEKVIDQRQTLKRKVKNLEDQLKDKDNDKSELEKLKAEREELSKMKEEYDLIVTAREEAELSKATETEKELIKARKAREAFEKEVNARFAEFERTSKEKEEEVDSLKNQLDGLRDVKLEREIIDAALAAEAYNPEQIVNMLKSSFKYDKDMEGFFHNVYGKKGALEDQIDVEAFVKDFLAKPINDNLVKSQVRSGTGTHTSKEGVKVSAKSGQLGGTGETKLSEPILKEKLESWAKEKGMELAFAYEQHRKYGDKIFK